MAPMLNHQIRDLARFSESAEDSYERARRNFAEREYPGRQHIPLAGDGDNPDHEEAGLFAEWKPRCDTNFIADGIIGDRKEWWDRSPRVLFLAKEANDVGNVMDRVGHDLRVLLRDADGYKEKIKKINLIFPDNCDLWARALHHWWGDQTVDFQKLPLKLVGRKALRCSAVVNLKKTAGGASANDRKLRDAAQTHKDLIERQLLLLKPDLIICCGTFEIVRRVFAGFQLIGPSGRLYLRAGVPWVDQWHPSYRRGPLEKVRYLQEALLGVSPSDLRQYGRE